MEENHKDHGKVMAKIHLELYEDDKVHSHIEGKGADLAGLLANELENASFRQLLTIAALAIKARNSFEQEQQPQPQAQNVVN